MNKCVIMTDSFKGTLSSLEICHIARASIAKFFPTCEVNAVPIADGGEGTVDCFIEAIDAKPVAVTVCGPYGEKVQAVYARAGEKAIIEMASAAGLPLVGMNRNPASTTTYGVGELMHHAVSAGCTELLLGLGGSCTNDGGCGCAAALGVRFLNSTGNSFVPVGDTLGDICSIDTSEVRKLLNGVTITVMCDVDNPLYGPTGAAHIFGPQKGADTEMVRHLDNQLRLLDATIQRELGLSVANIQGAGAAGGMGAGCIAFFGAELKSGIEAVLDMVNADRFLENADIVFTGEGRVDTQSLHGKVLSGVAKRIQAKNIPLVAIVGSISEDADEAYAHGVTAMFGIDREAVAFEKYADRSAENYRRTLEDILRLIDTVGTRAHS